MSSARVWITFTVIFSATRYCFTINFKPQATDRVRYMEQQMHLRSHADESKENFRRFFTHTKNIDRQPAHEAPSLTLCGYHVCFLDETNSMPNANRVPNWTLESVPKACDGCSCCSCCYGFRKMPKALLIRNGMLRNSIHIYDFIPARSTVLDF